ncbi:hypothetical protein HDU93_008402 [Gonapodya sp. JEL0774]|nr:hypothetical protein HDU93_008402 [Gonapodya sp. JEL0774]
MNGDELTKRPTVLADLDESRILLDRASELEDPNYSTDSLPLDENDEGDESPDPNESRMLKDDRSRSYTTVSVDLHAPTTEEALSTQEIQTNLRNEGSRRENSNANRKQTKAIVHGPVSRKTASSHGGGSSQTSESREARRARVMRSEFVTRLIQVPQKFENRLKALSILCVALAAFAIVYTNSVFASVASGVDAFLTTTEIGRTAVAAVQAARLMSYFGNVGDSANYQKWKQDLTKQNNYLGNVSLPYVLQRSADLENIVQVRMYYQITGVRNPAAPEVAYINQFELANVVNEYVRKLLAEEITFFQRFPPTEDYRIRFLVDNVITIGENLKAVCDVGQTDFGTMVVNELLVLWVTLVALIVFGILNIAFVWVPLLREVRNTQLRYLKYLPAISKKSIDEILLVIDEQLEFLTEDIADSKNAPTSQEDAIRMGRRRKDIWHLGLSLFAFYACACAILVPAIIRLPINAAYVQLVNYTGGRKFMSQMTRTLGYEVLIGDNSTWTFGEPEMHLKNYITKFEALHKNAVTGHGDKEITPTTSIPIVNTILEGFGCSSDVGCNPDVRNFNASIGYTYQEVISPVDQIISDYIRSAKAFLMINALRATHNFVDDRLLFMEAVQNDIVSGLILVDQLILKRWLPQDNSLALSISLALFVLSIAMFAVFYVFIYRKLIAGHETEMETVVTLVHVLPVMGQPVPDKLSRLIQSGGASVGEED